MLLHNGLEFPETLLACLRLGAIAVPINFRLTRAEIDYILADAAVATLVDGPLSADHEPAPQAAVAPGDGALLCYTSGTTGRPKGAFLSHANLVASTRSWIHEMGATADDVWLSGQPLFHIGGINGMLPFLALGAKAVITPTTGFDAHNAVRLMEQHAVTMCIFVPTQWDQVTAIPQRTQPPRRDVGRRARLATDPRGARTDLPRRGHRERLRPDRDVRRDHAAQGPRLDAQDGLGRAAHARRRAPARAEQNDDGVGEIVYRGPFVMRGYWNNPEATAEAFAGGWFHSGDLATRDEEGYLRLVDRKKDMIVSGGENIYPAEVERVLREHPAVADVAVVGAPHPRWGETPVAFVVGACTEQELIEHCRAHLASYKKPTAVHFVTELPRNAAGKVLKRELRAAIDMTSLQV